MSTELELSYREALDETRVFEMAAGYAPTMGLIGALLGLMHSLGSFSTASQMGQGVAEAFSATLLGIALANLFLLPVAGRLKQKSRHQWLQKTIIIQAILSIQMNEHPLVLKEKLNSFIRSDHPPIPSIPHGEGPQESEPSEDLVASADILKRNPSQLDELLQSENRQSLPGFDGRFPVG